MAQRGSTRPSKAEPKLRILTADELTALDDLKEEIVEVPEWGEKVAVKLRTLTSRQMSEVRKRATVKGQVDEDLAQLHGIVEAMVEPRLTIEQVNVLAQKSAPAVERLAAKVMEMNGLSSEALAAIEALFRAAADR